MIRLNEGIPSWKYPLGGSPGLVVMGGDSCNEGRGFESQQFIFGHFSHILDVKIVMFVLKYEMKQKRGREWLFLKSCKLVESMLCTTRL